jgi:hypothetical protein
MASIKIKRVIPLLLTAILNTAVLILMLGSSRDYNVFDLYSGFPHQNGNCEKVKEITLIDQWIIENNGIFS